jgi:predicted nucleic acid-binding protein
VKATYLDSSAVVKLVVPEAESGVLALALRGRATVSSAVSRVEVTRAVARRRAPSSRSPADVLAGLTLLVVDDGVLSLAATLGPPTLRTLDAIHLASALQLGSDLDAFITYDTRQATAAAAAGLPVGSPR